MYLDKNVLNSLILESQAAGCASSELCEMLWLLAQRVWRWRGSHSRIEQDDFCQSFTLHIILKLHLLDVTRSPFGYLTTSAVQMLTAHGTRLDRRAATLRRYADRVRRKFESANGIKM